MDEEAKKRIADFFTAEELVEFLGVTTMAVIEAFPDDLLEVLDELYDLMEYHCDRP